MENTKAMKSLNDDAAPLSVLIIDDDAFITEILKSITEKLGCSVQCIYDGKDVGAALMAAQPDVIFLDLVLPGIDGVEILQELARLRVEAKIILMSGLDQRTISSVGEVAKKSNLNLLQSIRKPFVPGQVEDILQPLIDSAQKPTPSQDIAQPANYGPRLRYEPEIKLQKADIDGTNWARVQLVWQMDNMESLAMGNLIQGSFLSNISKGLAEIILHEAGRDQLALGDTESVIGLILPVNNALIHDASTPEYLEGLVHQAKLKPHNVMLEFFETAVIDANESAIEVLSRLKIKGFKLAICIREEMDLILNTVKDLPVDELVLDMSGEIFRDNRLDKSETEFQVGSLVSYAKGVNILTTGKNVFSQQQLDFAHRCMLSKASGEQVCPAIDADSVIEFYSNTSSTDNGSKPQPMGEQAGISAGATNLAEVVKPTYMDL